MGFIPYGHKTSLAMNHSRQHRLTPLRTRTVGTGAAACGCTCHRGAWGSSSPQMLSEPGLLPRYVNVQIPKLP